jgi:catechol-2,3-dioxygenase
MSATLLPVALAAPLAIQSRLILTHAATHAHCRAVVVPSRRFVPPVSTAMQKSGSPVSTYVKADLDHVALRVRGDHLALAKWYSDVLQFEPIDFAEAEAGTCPFPSVRLSPTSILDFFQDDSQSDAPPNANHMCFALPDRESVMAVVKRVSDAGLPPEASEPISRSGARGHGMSVYLKDPAGNALEFRYYE